MLFHSMTNCVKLLKGTEISLTKAILEFKNRAREFFLALRKTTLNLQVFLKKLAAGWSIFSLKDRYRKKRKSTLVSLNLITK
jgi:hypothetical protein